MKWNLLLYFNSNKKSESILGLLLYFCFLPFLPNIIFLIFLIYSIVKSVSSCPFSVVNIMFFTKSLHCHLYFLTLAWNSFLYFFCQWYHSFDVHISISLYFFLLFIVFFVLFAIYLAVFVLNMFIIRVFPRLCSFRF